MRRLRSPAAAFIGTLVLATLTACTGGDRTNIFQLCGNDRIDPGEQCDDGAALSDTGDCLTTCVLAICGDTFVDLNREQCDLTNLRSFTCATLGFDAGTLVCSPTCQFDTSGCGLTFTPTPTATPTPTPTPTPPINCGDGVLEPGETCETCPQDCVVQPCTATPPQVRYAVGFAPPNGEEASKVRVLIGYRSSVLNLPSGSAASSRIRSRPSNSLFAVDNLGYAVRVNVDSGLNPMLPTGRLFTVDLDSCAGTPPPTASDVSCILESCANSDGLLSGCTCTISGP